MAFFRNRAVNWLNLHYGLHAMVIAGGGAFYTVYLLRAGVSLPAVLVAMAGILLGRFLIRPAIIPLAVRTGLKPLLIAGCLIEALQYPLLPLVHGVGPVLVLLCTLSSVGDTVYWSCYHAFFAALGDVEHRGHQVSAREAVAAVAGIISPLATGVVLVGFGAEAAFGMAAACQVAAAVPLLFTPNVVVRPGVRGVVRAAIPGVAFFLLDGFIGAGYVFVWQLTLFVSLGGDFLGYGGALALAALAGAIAGMLLGRHIDAGHGSRAVWLALAPFAAALLVRALAAGHPGLAVAANALAVAAYCLYIPTLMTAVYNLARATQCTLRFHVATEGGWDFGGAGGCLLAALMLHFGFSLNGVLLLPLIGAALMAVRLRRYYAVKTVTLVSP
ncbi:MAG: hypothetical protein BGN85_06960 [Alphaproteobacteria bacterium 64-11]|nr:hypothetical protein [Alphaproteobacteria bacterium]OJU10235.1 MAG: hypothetical protein BGN85_06960 [Alphaproteobacteria bacterium 64-11]